VELCVVDRGCSTTRHLDDSVDGLVVEHPPPGRCHCDRSELSLPCTQGNGHDGPETQLAQQRQMFIGAGDRRKHLVGHVVMANNVASGE